MYNNELKLTLFLIFQWSDNVITGVWDGMFPDLVLTTECDEY